MQACGEREKPKLPWPPTSMSGSIPPEREAELKIFLEEVDEKIKRWSAHHERQMIEGNWRKSFEQPLLYELEKEGKSPEGIPILVVPPSGYEQLNIYLDKVNEKLKLKGFNGPRERQMIEAFTTHARESFKQGAARRLDAYLLRLEGKRNGQESGLVFEEKQEAKASSASGEIDWASEAELQHLKNQLQQQAMEKAKAEAELRYSKDQFQRQAMQAELHYFNDQHQRQAMEAELHYLKDQLQRQVREAELQYLQRQAREAELCELKDQLQRQAMEAKLRELKDQLQRQAMEVELRELKDQFQRLAMENENENKILDSKIKALERATHQAKSDF